LTRAQANRIAIIVPFACSAIALAIVMANIIGRVPPQPDENTSAHLWQLLMAGQLPFIALFAATADWRRWVTPVRLLLMQATAFAAAAIPVWLAGY
jgi:hypothetical protein